MRQACSQSLDFESPQNLLHPWNKSATLTSKVYFAFSLETASEAELRAGPSILKAFLLRDIPTPCFCRSSDVESFSFPLSGQK